MSKELISSLKSLGYTEGIEDEVLTKLSYQMKFFNLFGVYASRFPYFILSIRTTLDNLPQFRNFINVILIPISFDQKIVHLFTFWNKTFLDVPV